MQINNQTPNQNFGMAIHSNLNVNNVLKARIKSAAALEKLNKIAERQAQNDKVDITLFLNPDGRSLSANVYDASGKAGTFFKSYTENPLISLFKSPVGFINKLSNVADKQADKIRKTDLNYDDVFQKM